LVLFGILVSFLAIQNTSHVTLQFAGIAFENIPLYLVILGSILFGFIIAAVVSSVNSMFAAFRIMGKNNVIKSSQSEIEMLKEKIRQLEVENAELKGSKK
jgi:uncharacterized integral membrane protein